MGITELRQFENRDACLQEYEWSTISSSPACRPSHCTTCNCNRRQGSSQCAEFDLSDVVTTSSGVAVDPGACIIIDIGVRSHTTTLAIDIEVLDDAMDVLMFDQNSIQPYQNGQNYRSSFNQEATFESMVGSQWLDWAPLNRSILRIGTLFSITPHMTEMKEWVTKEV